jgi:hypothetical protein
VLTSLEESDYEFQFIDFCYGLQYLTETGTLEIKMTVQVKECSFGLFGYLIQDFEDCYWRTYDILLPIAGIHFLHALDIDSRNYYFPWFCNYDLMERTGIDINALGQPMY